jgi:hypothetical protein
MLRQGGIQQTTDSPDQMVGAYFRLCQAGILVARIARRALPTLKSKRAIWLTILFHRSLSFRRRGKNCNVRTATPRHSISGPICGMTRNDWPRKGFQDEQVKRRGSDVCSAGEGARNRTRKSTSQRNGLRKKQREGSGPRTLFFWTRGSPCWRSSDKGKTYRRSTWPPSPVPEGTAVLHPNRP